MLSNLFWPPSCIPSFGIIAVNSFMLFLLHQINGWQAIGLSGCCKFAFVSMYYFVEIYFYEHRFLKWSFLFCLLSMVFVSVKNVFLMSSVVCFMSVLLCVYYNCWNMYSQQVDNVSLDLNMFLSFLTSIVIPLCSSKLDFSCNSFNLGTK